MKAHFFIIAPIYLIILIYMALFLPSNCYALDIGDRAIIDAGASVDPIIVATTEAANEDLLDALKAKDIDGLGELFDQGKIFTVSRHSKVLILKNNSWGLRKVRILEISDPSNCYAKIGWTCWVPMEYLK